PHQPDALQDRQGDDRRGARRGDRRADRRGRGRAAGDRIVTGVPVDAVLRDAARRLAAAGVDSPRLDARLLLGAVLGREVWPHDTGAVDDAAVEGFEALLVRRLAREPVSRILGRRAFWTLDLQIGPDTLDPRADSETLIEAAIAAFTGRPPPRRILDLGT